MHPHHICKVEEDWFLEYLGKDNLVLDLGCGNGEYSFESASICKRVVGIDFSSENLAVANRQLARNRLNNISFVKHNLETDNLPFQDSSFSAVLFQDVLEHLNRRNFVLLEISRVLQKDGLLFISVPNRDTSWKRLQQRFGLSYYDDADHKIEYTQNEIIAELTRSGFLVTEVQPIVYSTPLAGLIDLIGGFSLSIYKILWKWKKNMALKHPEQTNGWQLVCRKK